MGSKRLTPTTVGKMTPKCLFLLTNLWNYILNIVYFKYPFQLALSLPENHFLIQAKQNII